MQQIYLSVVNRVARTMTINEKCIEAGPDSPTASAHRNERTSLASMLRGAVLSHGNGKGDDESFAEHEDALLADNPR